MSAVYLPTNALQTIEHQTVYAYDTRHRLTSITQQLCTISSGHACSTTTPTGSDTYTYDDTDNRTQVLEANGATTTDYRYCHDALGQLTARRTAAACTTSPDETTTFDDAGNRTSALAGGVTTNFAYTPAGVLCDLEVGVAASCTGGNVGSDDAGRLAAYAGYTYRYDAQGRLVSACNDDDCVGTGFRRIDVGYDGEGHRTALTETPAVGSAVVTTFRYQGDRIAAEYRDGVLTREYVTDAGGTISKVIVPAGQTGTGTYLVTWNGHGDAMALYRIETTGALTLANSFTYSTWGKPTTATHNSIADLGFRFLYVGAADVQWDATYGLDLLYMHARHYSPSHGRFLQPDPSRLDAKLFAYAGNRPETMVDPAGLEGFSPEEWLVAAWYPSHGRVWISASGWAFGLNRAATWAGLSNNRKENAIRHCMWQCMITARDSWGWASLWGHMHEIYADDHNEYWDTKADYHNNYVGRLLGKRLWWIGRNPVGALGLCLEAWTRGWLYYVGTFHAGRPRNRLYWSNGKPVDSVTAGPNSP